MSGPHEDSTVSEAEASPSPLQMEAQGKLSDNGPLSIVEIVAHAEYFFCLDPDRIVVLVYEGPNGSLSTYSLSLSVNGTEMVVTGPEEEPRKSHSLVHDQREVPPPEYECWIGPHRLRAHSKAISITAGEIPFWVSHFAMPDICLTPDMEHVPSSKDKDLDTQYFKVGEIMAIPQRGADTV